MIYKTGPNEAEKRKQAWKPIRTRYAKGRVKSLVEFLKHHLG